MSEPNPNLDKEMDFSKTFLPPQSICFICGKSLPFIRKLRNLFCCDLCEDFRKQFPPETTIKEIADAYHCGQDCTGWEAREPQKHWESGSGGSVCIDSSPTYEDWKKKDEPTEIPHAVPPKNIKCEFAAECNYSLDDVWCDSLDKEGCGSYQKFKNPEPTEKQPNPPLGKAEAKEGELPESSRASAEDAASSCPTEAIHVT